MLKNINFIILGLLFLLQACATHVDTPHGRGSVVIDGDHHHGGHSGPRHCPPGHAKKGWC